MVQPAPRIISAPLKKHNVVVRTGSGPGSVYEAARSVEKRHGKKR